MGKYCCDYGQIVFVGMVMVLVLCLNVVWECFMYEGLFVLLLLGGLCQVDYLFVWCCMFDEVV